MSDYYETMAAEHRLAALRALRDENERLRAELAEANGWFKNFHRLLCDRFGYTHDEVDWQRDQLSLIEFIAAQLSEAKRLHGELLFQVINKYPGETRHETALRYIKQAETPTNALAQSQPKDGEKAKPTSA